MRMATAEQHDVAQRRHGVFDTRFSRRAHENRGSDGQVGYRQVGSDR